MIHAYDELYLEKARNCLGRMVEVVVYDLHYDLAEFWEIFLASGYADRFSHGEPNLLVGMSGAELACCVLSIDQCRPDYDFQRTPEYWTGWALAYYQWQTGLSFQKINETAPIETVCGLYSPYHEMDIRHFVDWMHQQYRTANPSTNLKRRRESQGLSQQKLATYSGVSVRTIQQYEQRQKDINKAQALRLCDLAHVLSCKVEDLMERIN